MTYDQFIKYLESKGIAKEEYVRRVSLMFFCADLANSLAIEIEAMMPPSGCVDGNIKHHIKKAKQHTDALIRHSDNSLDESCQEGFMLDGDTFKEIAYAWAKITK